MIEGNPPVKKFMTAQPYSIQANETVKQAEDVMAKHQIRHLPVMHPIKKGEVMGLISDRDIKIVCCIAEANPARMLVSNMCHQHPYVVEPETPLREVAKTMAEKRYEAAIIAHGASLVGIFTTVDACRALAELTQASNA